MKNPCFFLTILIILLYSCNNFTQSKSSKIIKVSYATGLPYFRSDINEQIENADTLNFYFKDNFIVLQKYAVQGNFKEDESGNADTANMIFIGETYVSSFFLYKINSKYGIYSDSLGNYKTLLADSFLQKTITRFTFSRDYKNIWKLFSTFKTDNLHQEKYASIEINTVSNRYDSMLLGFDKHYKDIKLSISPFLDSLYDSKLCDLRLIVSSYYDSANNVSIPRQEVFGKFDKQEITKAESVFINKLIEKYKTANLNKQ